MALRRDVLNDFEQCYANANPPAASVAAIFSKITAACSTKSPSPPCLRAARNVRRCCPDSQTLSAAAMPKRERKTPVIEERIVFGL